MAERNVTPSGNFPLSPRNVILIVIAIIVVFSALTIFFKVDAQEKGVVLFLGKTSRIVGPGINMKLPFGLETHYKVPVLRTITQEFGFRTLQTGVTSRVAENEYAGESIMLTGDKNIVDIDWIIQYEITDPEAWLFNVEHLIMTGYNNTILREVKAPSNPGDLQNEKTIRDVSQSVINQIIGDKYILDLIGSDGTSIRDVAATMMNETFHKYKMGIVVQEITFPNIMPPAGDVREAFQDVNKAEQDKERIINQAYEEYNKKIAQVDGEAQQMVEEAYGYKEERVNTSQGDIQRFDLVYEEYRKAPQITRERLYIEAFEAVFQDEKTELIDKNLQNFIPFKSLSQGGN